jgi:hypothetical protein
MTTKSVKKRIAAQKGEVYDIQESVVEKEETMSKKETVVDANRQSIIDMLTDMGVAIDDSKSTEALTADLKSHVFRQNKRLQEKESNIYGARLTGIKDKTNLSDDAFILKLIMMGVPDMYLISHRRSGVSSYLFNDGDAKLSDKQIWEKIRHSGINPQSTLEVFTKPFKRSAKYTKPKFR